MSVQYDDKLFEKRAAEKQASRDEDERALAAGEKTREQLVRENSRIVLRGARMVLSKSRRLS